MAKKELTEETKSVAVAEGDAVAVEAPGRRASWTAAEHIADKEREIAQLLPQAKNKAFGAQERIDTLKGEIAELKAAAAA